jgi:hypothetical protein
MSNGVIWLALYWSTTNGASFNEVGIETNSTLVQPCGRLVPVSRRPRIRHTHKNSGRHHCVATCNRGAVFIPPTSGRH